ncbi:MAG: hypothetical protein U0401_24805 [Anaerolineae bacterium]
MTGYKPTYPGPKRLYWRYGCIGAQRRCCGRSDWDSRFFLALSVGVALAQQDKPNQTHQAHETVYQFVVSF